METRFFFLSPRRRSGERIEENPPELRTRFGGQAPYLFGQRSIADAFYAPVATRLRTYAVTLPTAAQAYCEAIFADPAFKAWERAAHEETWLLPSTDDLYP